MKIKIERFYNGKYDTIGRLFIDGIFKCYTLEDEYREIKVPGDTRIPAGTYSVVLRTHGTHYEKYLKKFKDWFVGSLEIKDVPNFKDILIHIGNTEDDTAGCVLVGLTTVLNGLDNRNAIQQSTLAYQSIYPIISDALINKEEVTIEIIDCK